MMKYTDDEIHLGGVLLIHRPQDVPTGEGVRDGVGCAHHKKVQPGSVQIKRTTSFKLSNKMYHLVQVRIKITNLSKKFKKGTQFNSFRTSAQLATLSPT